MPVKWINHQPFPFLFLSEQGVVPLTGAIIKKFPAKIVSRLLSWKRVTYNDLVVLHYAKKLIDGGFVSRNDMLFCAVLERGSGKSLPLLLSDVPWFDRFSIPVHYSDRFSISPNKLQTSWTELNWTDSWLGVKNELSIYLSRILLSPLFRGWKVCKCFWWHGEINDHCSALKYRNDHCSVLTCANWFASNSKWLIYFYSWLFYIKIWIGTVHLLCDHCASLTPQHLW